ncbi:MAG: hypothetical protein ACXWUG_18390 [Polyangiales bacterium]
MRRAAPIIALVVCAAWSSVARADKATAQALFDEAKTLIAAGKWAEACPKLEESNRQDPGMATQFRLAECYEQIGKTASAWANYVEVADSAKAAGLPEREKFARDKAKAIEPRLTRLKIEVVDKTVSVTRDGNKVAEGQLGAAIPIDPGKHVIEASAPGKQTFRKEIDVQGEGATVSFSIPALADAPREAPSETHGSSRRTIGLVVGGLGVVTLAGSVFLGLAAKSKFNDSSPHCHDNLCDPDGVALRDSAVSRGNVATIVGGVGLVAIGVGVAIFVTAPKSEAPVAVGLGPRGLTLVGKF